MPAMKPVFSSHVAAIGYEPGALHVRYGNTGRTVVYRGVPPGVAADVMAAPSIGEALWRQVRDRFPHGYLKDG